MSLPNSLFLILNRIHKKKLFWLVSLLAAFVLAPVVAYAQSGGGYDLSWSTIDDGGAVSTGEAYALGGAAGQPDAGTLSGGAFELSGGFWRIKVEYPTSARMVSSIVRSPATSWVVLAALLAISVALRRRAKPPVSAAG